MNADEFAAACRPFFELLPGFKGIHAAPAVAVEISTAGGQLSYPLRHREPGGDDLEFYESYLTLRAMARDPLLATIRPRVEWMIRNMHALHFKNRPAED